MLFRPRGPVASILRLMTLLLAAGPLYSQEKPEASHRERFAPSSQVLQRAEEELNAKLAANPDDARLLSDRGLERLDANRPAEALADLRHAVELKPTEAKLHVNLAYGLLLTGHSDDGIAEARKALALDDKNAAAHALLGRSLAAIDSSNKEGIEHLERSLAIYPDQPDLRIDLANALRKAKDYAAAGVQVRILKDLLPPGDARLEYAQGMLSADLGYPEAAAASFRRALAANPNLVAARQNLGAALVSRGKWDEAAAVLGEAANGQPDSFTVAYLHALALQNTRRSKEAETEARRALTIDRNSTDARTLLGIALMSQARYADAIAELSQAVASQPASFDAQFYLGRARYALNDTAGSAQALGEAVKLRPEDAEARFFLGTVLEVSGDKDGAIRQYRELQRLRPQDPRGYTGLGSILSKYGQNDEALEQLRQAHNLNPGDFETNMALGRLLAKMGHVEESIPALQEASRQRPESPEVHYQLALSLQRAGRRTDAAREFAEVERLNQARRTGGESPPPPQ
jgi:tetratricopeptide (TPR) repeat protein